MSNEKIEKPNKDQPLNALTQDFINIYPETELEVLNYLLTYYPPNVVDLFAYYRNERTESLARQNPDRNYYCVGQEFLCPNNRQNKLPIEGLSNIFNINMDALQFLNRLQEASLEEVHLIILLPDFENVISPKGRDLIQMIKKALKPGGILVTLNRLDIPYEIKNCLEQEGFSVEETEFDANDLKSDFIGRNFNLKEINLQDRYQIKKLVAVKDL